MVSTVRYTSFKSLAFGRKPHTTVLGLALLFALIYFYSRWTLLVLAAAYTLSGPVARIYSAVRSKHHVDERTLAQPLKTSEP